jgi:predicted ester cyclase
MAQIIDTQFAVGFLDRLHTAVNAHDAAAVAALCCEDVVWDDPAASTPLHGREAVYRFHHETMFRALPDVRIELIDGPCLAFDGTSIATRLRISGTMTGPLIPPGFAPTNGPLAFETAEFSKFDGGLLSRHTVVINMLGLARQIGAVPAPGGLADRIGIWGQHVAAWVARRRR